MPGWQEAGADAVRANALPQARSSEGTVPLSESQLEAVSGGFVALGDMFKELPTQDLLGGPLASAAEQQARLAAATRAFIEQTGLKP